MSENNDTNNKTDQKQLDDEALEKLAVQELMREAVQGAARAEIIGPSGWVRGPQNKTNKRFLVNTIRNAVASNKYRSQQNIYKHSPKESTRHLEPSIKKDRLKKKH